MQSKMSRNVKISGKVTIDITKAIAFTVDNRIRITASREVMTDVFYNKADSSNFLIQLQVVREINTTTDTIQRGTNGRDDGNCDNDDDARAYELSTRAYVA